MGGTCQTQLGGRHHKRSDPAQTSSPSLPVLSALTSHPISTLGLQEKYLEPSEQSVEQEAMQL